MDRGVEECQSLPGCGVCVCGWHVMGVVGCEKNEETKNGAVEFIEIMFYKEKSRIVIII